MSLDETMRDIEEGAADFRKEFMEDLKDSPHGRLKALAVGSIPVALGALMGGVGRITNTPELPAFYAALNLFLGGVPIHSGRAFGQAMWSLLKYSAGAAAVYADKLYPAAKSLVERF